MRELAVDESVFKNSDGWKNRHPHLIFADFSAKSADFQKSDPADSAEICQIFKHWTEWQIC
jgi:hypothetical protein